MDTPSETGTHDFRWQALFQRTRDPLFVLNRRRRILFVNRAWEELTGMSAAEARGLVCLRRTPNPQDPPDLVIRALCCPPPEVLKGQPGRTRRLVPGADSACRWWDVEFFPLRDEREILCVLGKITRVGRNERASAPPLPEKLVALREGITQRYGLDQLGSSVPSFQRVVDQVRLASQTQVPVLILGEPGTGKRWLAATIHYQGLNREGAFATVDCARLPATALAAILFGDGSSPWRTARGTQYLRELSHLPLDVQRRLCDRLGESSGVAGARTIAGCSVDLLEEIRAGRLLEDLQCALATLVITLPPLRARQPDLPGLVERMLQRANMVNPRPVTGLTPQAWEIVHSYAWPGNLRELYAVLQTACLRSADDHIDACHLPAPLRLAVRLEQTPTTPAERPLPLDGLLEQVERRLIRLALHKAQGNRSRAAELLSIWRPRLLRRMEALGITKAE